MNPSDQTVNPFRILFVCQFFPPDLTAQADRNEAMARLFSSRGHQVTVFTENPNHPRGIAHEDYGNPPLSIEVKGNLTIRRCWVFLARKKTFITRLLFYLSYALQAALFALFNARRFDMVFCCCPPLFNGIAGWLTRLVNPRIRFVFDIQDLWPQTAIELGLLKNPAVITIARAFEQGLYRRTDLFVAVTEGIYHTLDNQYPGKVVLARNGTDTHLYTPKETWTEPEFTAVYAGNHGLVSGMEVIIEAALLLTDKPIRFLLIGDGPLKPKLRALAEQYRLGNITFHDSVEPARMPAILHAASVGLSTSADLPINHGRIPVKLFTYMASALPVVAAETGEAACLVHDGACGLVVPPENPLALAEALIELLKDTNLREEFGRNGRRFAVNQYGWEVSAGVVCDAMEKLREGDNADV